MVSDPLADLARLDGVPSALAAARDAVDLRLRDRGYRVLSADQRTRSLIAGAEASAELTDEPERWRIGAHRLAAELSTLSGLIRVAPGQALARAHVLVATGQVAEDALGRLRADPEVAARMRGVSDLLTAATQAPVLVLAAVAHAEIVTLAPFGSADGLIARAAERMVLISSGVDPQAGLPVEVGHLTLAADYERGLRAYATGSMVGVRDWLLHCATAVTVATNPQNSW